MDRIWLTGFRSYELGVFGTKDPKLTIIKFAIEKILRQSIANGTEWLITGGQLGVEQWAIEVAVDLKVEFPGFKIALMTPFKNFGAQWNETNKEKLQQLKQQVDFSTSVYQGDYNNRTQLISYQQFMLAHTDGGIIFYDDEATESKARFDADIMQQFSKQHDYPIMKIDLDRLQEFANDYQETQQLDDFY